MAISEPLDPDTVRIAVDRGVNPPLVWIANGAGRGTLLQLAGEGLSLKGNWADDDDMLSSPGQYGFLPILNIGVKLVHTRQYHFNAHQSISFPAPTIPHCLGSGPPPALTYR